MSLLSPWHWNLSHPGGRVVKFIAAAVHSFSVRSPTRYLCQQRLSLLLCVFIVHIFGRRPGWDDSKKSPSDGGGRRTTELTVSAFLYVQCMFLHVYAYFTRQLWCKGTKGVLLWNCNWVKMHLSACLSVLMSPISFHLINIKYRQGEFLC